eukprot:gene41169-50233_t
MVKGTLSTLEHGLAPGTVWQGPPVLLVDDAWRMEFKMVALLSSLALAVAYFDVIREKLRMYLCKATGELEVQQRVFRGELLLLGESSIRPSVLSNSGSSEKISESSCWSLYVLHSLQEELDVQDKYFQAYLPLVPRDYEMVNTDCVEAFVSTLRLSNVQSVDLVIRLILFLLAIGKYDGRGRSLARSLAHTFNLADPDFHFLETQLSLYLVQHTQHQGLHTHSKTERTAQEQYWRYAKIGAVGLAAGGVLAVTGGLAAPAVAGALILLGGGSVGVGVVGGVVTSPLLAGLFGSGGLTLTSYKMSRRTKGLGEFRLVRIVPEIEEGRGGKGADLATSNDKEDKGKSDKASKTDKTDKSDAVHEISEDNPDAHTLPRLSLL